MSRRYFENHRRNNQRGGKSWSRIWNCFLQPFRRRRRDLSDESVVEVGVNSNGTEQGREYRQSRWETIRGETPRESRREMRRTVIETRGEVRKRFRAPSPETFDKLRQAIIQVEASNDKKRPEEEELLECQGSISTQEQTSDDVETFQVIS